ncbi:MAG TPA: hypothetical protein VIZ58_09760, partial [Thermoanaerobaculia bacterium]
MKALFEQVVFSVAGRDYLWEDVVLAAESRGDWARLRERAAEGFARLRRWEEEPEALEEGEIESAANEFRYDRDLISAEEMETWLARWGLTAESWMDYVRGSLLRRKWSGDPTGIAETESSEPEFEEHLLAEAVCSGELRRLAETLAGRAAIASREAKERAAADPSGEPGHADGAGRRDATMERLALLEDTFRRFSER